MTYWPTVEVKLESIGERSVNISITGRFLPVTYPYAKYSSSVNDKTYSHELTAGPCITFACRFTFHPPEAKASSSDEVAKELERDAAFARATGQRRDFQSSFEHTMVLIFKLSYKPIQVRYEGEYPDKSVLDPTVLQSAKSQLYSSLTLILFGCFLLGGSSYKRYLDSLGSSDPMLFGGYSPGGSRRRR